MSKNQESDRVSREFSDNRRSDAPLAAEIYGKNSGRRFVAESEQQLQAMRRAIATRRGGINDVGRSVMQRAEWYALNLGLRVMPGFLDGKQKRTCGPWALMTSNLEEIRAFGGGWNGGLIFTPTGESIITLDVDNKNGKRREKKA